MTTIERPVNTCALEQSFSARPAKRVARDLLGKVLVRQLDDARQYAVIHEVEAYIGPHDLACHAAKGCTPRTSVMFGPAGYWYVYFIYGIHWMLNVVTERDGYPAAVLIRGAGSWTGPAKLTKALSIDKSFNGLSAMPTGEKGPLSSVPLSSIAKRTKAAGESPIIDALPAPGGLWIEDHELRLPRGCVESTPRIGVDYAGIWADKPYRYVIEKAAAQRLQQLAVRNSNGP